MANPNKSARGSGKTPASRAAAAERTAESPFVQDMGKFQRGEMSADDFCRKWER
jgi:hypothetical protein